MIRIDVSYTSQIRAILGIAHETVELPAGTTLEEVLSHVISRHAQALQGSLVDANGDLSPTVMVCVGDEQVPLGVTHPMSDGDHVTLLSAISGG